MDKQSQRLHPDQPETPPSLVGAVMRSPGPRSFPAALLLTLKGIAMGTADIIPGVSGGTVAFITGIYDALLRAIRSVDARLVTLLLTGRLRDALQHVHLRFLIPLFLGIAISLLTTARLVSYLLEHHKIHTYALFFGLILASAVVIARKINHWNPISFVAILAASGFSYVFVGMVPVETPETWWFVMLSGAVAICAMILPGVSGALLLLILGKYEYIIDAVHHPTDPGNMLRIATLGGGCIIGILVFSRVLGFLLAHCRNLTMCGLTGLMIGALRKIWPWKEVHGRKTVGDKVFEIDVQNILPPEMDTHLAIAVGLIAVGFVMVIVVEYVSHLGTPSTTDVRAS